LLLDLVLELLFYLVVEIVAAFVDRAFGSAPPQSRRGKLDAKVLKARAKIRVKRAARQGRCVLCKEDLGADDVQGCDVCRTAVHPPCARELTAAGGCPTLGCEGSLHEQPAPQPRTRRRRGRL
jgi:hypothetical protein